MRVDGFWIDRHEVTNAEFAEFVKATGYVTLAQRGLDPKTHPNMTGDLTAPGSVVFVPPTRLDRGGDITQWWQYVKSASWREPEGPGSSIEGKENYPVVHVAWRGRDLPTEAPCSTNYCTRYRATARQPQEADLSAGHLGFLTL